MIKEGEVKMKENILKVNEESELLSFLEKAGYSKNKAKSLLKYENVWVNGQVSRQFNTVLQVGDTVSVTNQRKVCPPFPILFEDREFLVVYKKERLLTASFDNSEKNLYQMARIYLEKKMSHEKLFLLHRLDKETSGIVVFCKRPDLAKNLQDNWNTLVKRREYTAVLEGTLQEKTGTLVFYLEEQGEKPVVVSHEKTGKKAITHYQVLKENQQYSLVQVLLATGRKNQIRVSFSHIGHSVAGDKKYYAKTNPIGRVALVHNAFEFVHPITKKTYRFEVEVPKSFLKLVR